MRQVQSSRQLHHFSLQAVRDFFEVVHRTGLGLEGSQLLASLVAADTGLDEYDRLEFLLELATGMNTTPDLLNFGRSVGLAHVLEGKAGLLGTDRALDTENMVAGIDVLLALDITTHEGLEENCRTILANRTCGLL